MKFKTRYNYKPETGLLNTQESKTFQECKDDCDINILYRKYLSKGLTPPNVLQLEARYADISNAQSFEELLNVQNDVKSMFNDLPSEIRESCGYNVDMFIGLVSEQQDDKDVKELQTKVFETLGMTQRKQELYKPIDEKPIVIIPPIKNTETGEAGEPKNSPVVAPVGTSDQK